MRTIAAARILPLLALSGVASAQGPSTVVPVLATTLAPASAGTRLTVSSSAFRARHTLPVRYTSFGASESPPLTWSKGPAGTQSYVVLVEDAGVPLPQPIIHWVLYNVPATVTQLPQSLPKTPELTTPAGAMNGLNIARRPGYVGPRPPKGQKHPYHFEVFALDETLSLSPDMANRNAVVDAMKGHVLAEGEIVAYVRGK